LVGNSLILKAQAEVVSISSISVIDADKDGVPEIFTVGKNSTGSNFAARLSVWHLIDWNLVLVSKTSWLVGNETYSKSVFAADLDNNGDVEIVTAGYSDGLKNSSGQLCVWHRNGNSLVLQASKDWQLVSGVYALNIAGGVLGNTLVDNVQAGDVDGDGFSEIITGGFAYDGEKVNAQLTIWGWKDNTLFLKTTQEWISQDMAEIKFLAVNDVNNDGKNEIITAGMSSAQGGFSQDVAAPETAQLRVWNFDGSKITLESSQDWVVDDGVAAWNVDSADVDGDGVTEIVSVGCSYFNNLCDPDLRIWTVENTEASPISSVLIGILVALLVIIVIVVVLFVRRSKKTMQSS
jgi:hypothetical protein